MLISKFNKIIRNKFIWGIFAVLVCVSFIGFFTSTGGCGLEKTQGDVAARLGGKDIPFREYQWARFNTYLSLILTFGRQINVTEKIDRELKRQTWERIAALRAAKACGLETGDDEVLAAIQRDERFAVEGAFSKARYQSFIQGVLQQLNASANQFEEITREDITLQKMQNMIGTAAWVPPREMARLIAAYADSFILKYVALTPARFAGDVRASPADCRAYFDAHTNRFAIPEKVQVRYVAFPVANYLNPTSAIPSEDLEDYYYDHRRDFVIEDTNVLSLATNAVETLRPLEDVRDVIRSNLVRTAAAQAALDAARDFSYSLTPDRQGNALSFEASVAQARFAAVTTAHFSLREKIAGLEDAGYALNRAAFELRPTPEDSFSDGILGSNAAYVINLVDRQDSRIPDFAEVAAQVEPLATQAAQTQALDAKAREVQKAVRAALHGGKSFEQAVATYGLPVTTTEVFTAFSAPEELSDYGILSDLALRNTGDLTGLTATTNGLIFGFVVERKPAEETAKQAVQQQVMSSLIRQRGRALYAEWQKHLLLSGNFAEVTNAVSAQAAAPVEEDL